MKRFLFAAVLMALVCGAAVGQDFPKVEVFGGYSFLRLGISDSDLDDMVSSIEAAAPTGSIVSASSSKFMMKGFNVSAAFNATQSFGIVADFRYNQDNIVEFNADTDGSTVSGKVKLRDISFMAGPRFTLRKNERITPFVHGLVGLDRWKISGSVDIDGQNVELDTGATSNGLGVAVGGGLDVNVNKHIAIRLVQADYFLTRHESETWNNINLAFGVVFRFGK